MGEDTIDGFAGPGGWDLAARQLGLDPLGIEWDDAACKTRAAAGLRTLQADITMLDPMEFAPVRLAIFSAPCQAFSMAGAGAGRRALEAYREAIAVLSAGGSVDVEKLDAACEDPRGHLVLEPLRWTLALRPESVACEQVEPVLPLWEAMAAALRRHGYRTWTGVLSAEQYGVPQTRRRAFLMASLVKQPECPAPTHQRYVAPRVRARQEESLFAVPEPERIVRPEDRDLRPWVSMAQALGWGMTARPVNTLTATNGNGGPRPLDGGAHGREVLAAARRRGEWRPDDRVGFPRRDDRGTAESRERDFREASEPAFTVTEKARSAIRMRANNQANATERGLDEPAPTIAAGHSTASREWVVDTGSTHSGASPDGGRLRDGSEPAPTVTSRADQLERRTHYDSRRQKDGRTGEPNRQRSVAEPAPTIAGESRNDSWVHERPATTVAGDPRVFPPGHKTNADDEAAGRDAQRRSGAGLTSGEDGATAIRVSEQEAAVLQGFPVDYPWQGTRTAKYRQIGDAVPPALARAVLEALL